MLRSNSGQAIVEYAFVVALVSIVAITSLHLLGHRVHDVFGCVFQEFDHHRVSDRCHR